MKKLSLSILFCLMCIVNAFAYEPTDLATSVISIDADPKVEIIRLYNSQLQKQNSKVSLGVADIRDSLIEAKASDLILLYRGQSSGVTTISYLLPLRAAFKSQVVTKKFIAVDYISDLGEEEIGLSTRIYLTSFVDVKIKSIR